MREIRWSDEELNFAITVCALSDFCNRWFDATGVHDFPDDAHPGRKQTAELGYMRRRRFVLGHAR